MVVQCKDEAPKPKPNVSADNDENGVCVAATTVSVASQRRTSARLQMLKKTAKPAPKCHPTIEKVSKEKTARVCKKRKLNSDPPATLPDSVSREAQPINDVLVPRDCNNDGGAVVNGSFGEKSAHALVTETLRTFNKLYLQLIQEEENRCRRNEADQKTNKGRKSKKAETTQDDTKRASKRPDLKAITKMMQMNSILNPEKRFGSIPGIDVGHQFFSRAEMVVVGFHSHWLNGIDFIGQTAGSARKSGKKQDYSGYKLPLAVSIVLSGQYEDDLDNCEDIVYTGQGGNDLLGGKHQIKDQVMERGNLGLKNCMEQSVPIRVVRGHKCQNSYVGKVYTYDGLYKVVNYWAEKGISGFTVYKFRLKRLEGQPPLTTDQVCFTRGRVPNSISEIRGLVCEDLTGGLENIPIPVTNLVDDPPVGPTGFTYIKRMKFAKGIKIPSNAPGCNCQGSCVDPRRCACAKLNGGDFPYVHHNGGRLIEPRAVVFECGPSCGCGPDCVNRVSQRGLKYRLEVFRTPKKGWGVRSWDNIPSGAPVCEYIGYLMKTEDLDPSADNSYVFDIDCLQTMRGLDGRERRLRDVSLPDHVEKVDEETSESVPFCINAGSTGNVARFINHSCQPNLFVQCVLSDHHDLKLARVTLIAADNIPALKELSYDYGYALDSVVGPDGLIRQMFCYCGAVDCRKRLY